MDYLNQAIYALKTDAEYTYSNNDYSTIQWIKLDGVAPTQAEIDAKIEEIKAKEITDKAAKATAKAELLAKLGITAEEAKLLLG
jgi:hypothetical protein